MRGVGLITGAPARIRFCPAPADSGLNFHRVDLRRAEPIPALAEQVSGTERRTTLGRGANAVTLVEHVLSALAGLRIDDCRIELEGPEPPGLDGSALGMVELLSTAGVARLSTRRAIWAPTEAIVIKDGAATIGLYPSEGESLRMSYLLNYGNGAPIPPQLASVTLTPDAYRRELAFARTFVLEAEAAQLQQAGVGRHLTSRELLVFGARGVIDNQTRRANEPARHKLLDIVGDLALCGVAIAGRLVAYRSGHPLNVELARTISRLARRAGFPIAARRAA
jgi:UDP-3-O-acyl N-acetylglucosamine deacetylase